MPERPLLILPHPGEPIPRVRRRGGGGGSHFPSRARQAERLDPKFETLQRAMEARRVRLQVESHDLVPEEVVVLETVGAIDGFIRAVEKVPGMEWLAEIDETDIPPDEDFFETTGKDKRRSEKKLERLRERRESGGSGELSRRRRGAGGRGSARPRFDHRSDERSLGLRHLRRSTRGGAGGAAARRRMRDLPRKLRAEVGETGQQDVFGFLSLQVVQPGVSTALPRPGTSGRSTVAPWRRRWSCAGMSVAPTACRRCPPETRRVRR